MTRALDLALIDELRAWEQAGLRRTLPVDDGKSRIDLISNDYLGLARDPRVIAAAQAAIERAGAGSGAARLLGGGLAGGNDAARAEQRVAEWLGEDAALLFASGWHANLGVIPALAGRGDALFSDQLNHASLIDGARLSRARVDIFAHGDLDQLAHQLTRSRGARRRVVVVEALYSMDGDLAPLAALHELLERHDATIVVDEAHSVGLLGPHGAGAWAQAGLPRERLAARIVTGGKALGIAGAFVVGSAALQSLLVNKARPFVFTTAPPPAVCGALVAAITIAREADDARARTLRLAAQLAKALRRTTPGAHATAPDGAIVPFHVGDARATLALGRGLAEAGFAVGAVRPPTVPEGAARLRFVVHAHNDENSIARAATALRALIDAPGGVPFARPRAAAATLATPWFVVGTDTDVGKTVVSALLLRAARRLGPAAYWKPVQTGAESDTAAVAALAEASAHELLAPLHHFALPASPHTAAAAAGATIEPAALQAALTAAREQRRGARLIVELAGGLLVPYRAGSAAFLQLDWLAHVRPRIVVVARSGLGTLNHTLLTLEALRSRGLEPDLLLLVGEPHPANAATLRELAGVPALHELPHLAPLSGAALDAWLAHDDLAAVLRR